MCVLCKCVVCVCVCVCVCVLYMYDELLAVNGRDVSRMDHGDIVSLIKGSGTTIQLTVQQSEGEMAGVSAPHLYSLQC